VTLLGREVFQPPVATTITMNNDNIAKPFGTLDTPGQGQTVSGTVPNFGWALTPDTDTIAGNGDIEIPINGSTVVVFIDGSGVATVTYNQCRGTVGNPVPGGVYCDDDVASIFGNTTPQAPVTPRVSNPTKFRNLDAARAAIGSHAINTTLLSNGLHSIAWSVTDSMGRVEGIGSRNFIVLNGGGAPAPAPAMTVADWLARPATAAAHGPDVAALRVARRDVTGRTGFDLSTPFATPRRSGPSRVIALETVDRLELRLGGPVTAGYVEAAGRLESLPLGSVLDTARGVFTWDPPMGYFGTYRLVFVNGRERIPVQVTIGDRGQIGLMPVDAPRR
jgi:hypothetical protein